MRFIVCIVSMLSMTVAVAVFAQGYPGIVTCSSSAVTSCAPSKSLSSVAKTDLVLFCDSGAAPGALQKSCTVQYPIVFGSVQSWSIILTTAGWYSLEKFPGLVPSPVPTPAPPSTPTPASYGLTIAASQTSANIDDVVKINWSSTYPGICNLSGTWGGTAFGKGSNDAPIVSDVSTYTIECGGETATVLVKYSWKPCYPTDASLVDSTKVGDATFLKYYCDIPRGVREIKRVLDPSLPKCGYSVSPQTVTPKLLADIDAKCFTNGISASHAAAFDSFETSLPLVAVVVNGTAGAIDAPVYSKKADGTIGPKLAKRVPLNTPCSPYRRIVKIVSGAEVGTDYYAISPLNEFAQCKLNRTLVK
jgi:hypothetical protein